MAAMKLDEKLTDEQRQAVNVLSEAPEHAGESKLAVFRSLPARAKVMYFREHFLVPLLAAVIIIALLSFMVMKAVTPSTRPKLYAARSSTAPSPPPKRSDSSRNSPPNSVRT